MIYKLPTESSIYSDSDYLGYILEDNTLKRKAILLKTQRKSNSKLLDTQGDKKLNN